MNREHRLLCRRALPAALPAILAAVLLLAFLAPGAARAQELYSFTVSALGGIGGSPDVDRGDDLTNTGYQLNLSMVTDPRTHVGLRLGKLGLPDEFGSLVDSELTYVTLGGEYRARESYYTSGLYFALGGYQLEGERNGETEKDTSIGLAIGATGEFQINRYAGIVVEISAHYADLEEAQIFGMAHAGVAFHF